MIFWMESKKTELPCAVSTAKIKLGCHVKLLTCCFWHTAAIHIAILLAAKRKIKVTIITIPCPYLSGTANPVKTRKASGAFTPF